MKMAVFDAEPGLDAGGGGAMGIDSDGGLDRGRWDPVWAGSVSVGGGQGVAAFAGLGWQNRAIAWQGPALRRLGDTGIGAVETGMFGASLYVLHTP